jgi:hypothetical protein
MLKVEELLQLGLKSAAKEIYNSIREHGGDIALTV